MRFATDLPLEGTGFATIGPAAAKGSSGVANRTRRHERRSHLQVQVRNGNACLEWLSIAFPFVEGPRVRIRLSPATSLAQGRTQAVKDETPSDWCLSRAAGAKAGRSPRIETRGVLTPTANVGEQIRVQKPDLRDRYRGFEPPFCSESGSEIDFNRLTVYEAGGLLVTLGLPREGMAIDLLRSTRKADPSAMARPLRELMDTRRKATCAS